MIWTERVYQLYQAGHKLAPSHACRDGNQWAHEPAHPKPKGFVQFSSNFDGGPLSLFGEGGFDSEKIGSRNGPIVERLGYPPATSGRKVGVLGS